MTELYTKDQQIADLQARNTELVEENRKLKRENAALSIRLMDRENALDWMIGQALKEQL